MERGLSRKHIIEGKIFSYCFATSIFIMTSTFIFKTQLNQVVHSCMCHHSHIKAACLYDITINIYETGLRASLERLQLEYIDVVFANRPDPNTPIEGGCA